MYIEPLTLFIIAEIMVVYVIITAFLFYKGRLYHVLIAILKEMRWERLQRQQQKQQEMAALRAQNKQLSSDAQAATARAETAGQSISEQLEHRVHELSEEAEAEGAALEEAPDTENNKHLNWLRLKILELEQKLLSNQISKPEWQEQLSRLLEMSVFSPGGSGSADSGDLEQLTAERDQYQNRFESASDRLALLEKEITALRAISVQDEPQMERPQKGMYAEEIYKLKCEKFDMQEELNKTRLMLQQMSPDEDEYQESMTTQMEQLETYIHRADMSMNLLEKELEAVNHENEALETQVKELKNRLKDISVATDKASVVNQKNVDQLAENTSKKSKALANLRNSIEQLRHSKDPEAVLEIQEGEISRLELLVRDSETCISVLESELENALRQIESLGKTDNLEQQKLPSSALNDRLGELNSQQQSSLNNLKGHIDAIREGGDAMEIIIQQEVEIDTLKKGLEETRLLVSRLQSSSAGDDSGAAAAAEKTKPKERAESNEDMEEMESLVKEFITDMQSMMSKIKELEEENKKLTKTS